MTSEKADDKTLDAEAAALSKVVGALTGLQTDAQQRVIRYAAERFNLSSFGAAPISINPRTITENVHPRTGHPLPVQSQFADAGKLLEQAQPKTGLMRVLAVGYWLQVCQTLQNFSGQEVNDILKDLGHQSANITADMSKLKGKKPALIQQIAKSGKAQQARKKYRVTAAGIVEVTRMLSGQTDEKE